MTFRVTSTSIHYEANSVDNILYDVRPESNRPLRFGIAINRHFTLYGRYDSINNVALK